MLLLLYKMQGRQMLVVILRQGTQGGGKHGTREKEQDCQEETPEEHNAATVTFGSRLGGGCAIDYLDHVEERLEEGIVALSVTGGELSFLIAARVCLIVDAPRK